MSRAMTVRDALKAANFVLNLSGAQIKGADLSNTNLSRANLVNTNLRLANLRNSNFAEAKLKGAILIGADLTGARNLTSEQLAEAVIDESTKLPDYLRSVERPAK